MRFRKGRIESSDGSSRPKVCAKSLVKRDVISIKIIESGDEGGGEIAKENGGLSRYTYPKGVGRKRKMAYFFLFASFPLRFLFHPSPPTPRQLFLRLFPPLFLVVHDAVTQIRRRPRNSV